MATRSKKLTGSASGVIAYLTDEEATLGTMAYYDGQEGSKAFTRVWGEAGLELGLERGLSREQFTRLFHGQHPDTGEQLAKSGYREVTNPDGTVEMVETRTPMIDVVYGAPKSLAVLYVSATPALRAKLDEVMFEAAHAAHNTMEQTAKLARISVKTPTEVGARTTKQQGSQTERVTASLIAVPVIQYTARHTDESLERGVPDPQIHVHSPIFTLCKVGDKWLTADEFGMKSRTNAKHRDAVFMGELARGLEDLGVELDYNDFDRAKGGEVRWEVKGTDEELRRYWSTNNEKAWRIRREYEEKHGKPIDEVTLGEILYATRKKKTPEAKAQDSHPNWDLWRDDADKAGFPLDTVPERQPITHDAFTAVDILRERLLSPHGLCIEDAVFDEASIRPAVARCGVGLGFSPDELAGYARSLLLDEERKELVLVRDATDRDHRLWTTQTIIDAEQDIADHRDSHRHQWVDGTGPAGTGKSHALGVAVEAIRSLQSTEVEYEGKKITLDPAPIAEATKALFAGKTLNDGQYELADAIVKTASDVDNVIVVSTAAATAERTGLKVKADSWGSVESIVSRIERKQLEVDDKTLVVIEEAGQLDTLRAAKLLKAIEGAKVVSLGDTSQLSAIGAGGWYADALERHGSIELTEVRRQKDEQDVFDYDLVREGRADRALENLAERGRVHLAEDDSSRMAAVFTDYKAHREAGRSASDVRVVLDASNQEVDVANRFVQRDRVARGELGEDAVEVENQDGRRWHLHANDEIVLLDTIRVKGQDPVKNGVQGTIKEVDGERAVLQLDGGREVNVPISAAIGVGYARHIAKYQGGEAPVVMVVPGHGTNRNNGYTSLTRGVEESHVYVSGSVDELAENWTRKADKASAHSIIERVREEEVDPLPPARTDEIEIEDIELEEVTVSEPSLDVTPQPEIMDTERSFGDDRTETDTWEQADGFEQEIEVDGGMSVGD